MQAEAQAMLAICDVLAHLPSDEKRCQVLASVAALLGFYQLAERAIDDARKHAKDGLL
jgi:hypothetical protein